MGEEIIGRLDARLEALEGRMERMQAMQVKQGDKIDVLTAELIRVNERIRVAIWVLGVVYTFTQGIGLWAYRDWETDRKSTRLNSSHSAKSRMPSSA